MGGPKQKIHRKIVIHKVELNAVEMLKKVSLKKSPLMTLLKGTLPNDFPVIKTDLSLFILGL